MRALSIGTLGSSEAGIAAGATVAGARIAAAAASKKIFTETLHPRTNVICDLALAVVASQTCATLNSGSFTRAMKEVDFASLLCSRLCHDLMSPVGALN